ncbi:hypothetical protein AB1Y20_015001 [Prymnesium parvum]|uniref:Uncharacterized protein n=1 Tax=Prymnesium parvum TaxID=97485 RepID=A0AB34JZD2_PRYPA
MMAASGPQVSSSLPSAYTETDDPVGAPTDRSHRWAAESVGAPLPTPRLCSPRCASVCSHHSCCGSSRSRGASAVGTPRHLSVDKLRKCAAPFNLISLRQNASTARSIQSKQQWDMEEELERVDTARELDEFEDKLATLRQRTPRLDQPWRRHIPLTPPRVDENSAAGKSLLCDMRGTTYDPSRASMR